MFLLVQNFGVFFPLGRDCKVSGWSKWSKCTGGEYKNIGCSKIMEHEKEPEVGPTHQNLLKPPNLYYELYTSLLSSRFRFWSISIFVFLLWVGSTFFPSKNEQRD